MSPRTQRVLADRVPTTGVGVQEAWLYTWCGLVLYALMLYGLSGTVLVARAAPPDVWLWLLLATGSAAFVGFTLFCRVLYHGLWAATLKLSDLAMLLLPAAAASIVSLVHPDRFLLGQVPLFIAASTLAFAVPRSMCLPVLATAAAWVVGAVTAGQLLQPAATQQMWADLAPNLAPTLFMAALTPLMVLISVWWWSVVFRLDAARQTESDLAVTRERLRFASDLHDIQGHHLQVIALKAELAERLLDRDLRGARQQLQETRQEAQTALEQTRALVQGLRQVSLEEELANAADVLSSAGIVTTHEAGGGCAVVVRSPAHAGAGHPGGHHSHLHCGARFRRGLAVDCHQRRRRTSPVYRPPQWWYRGADHRHGIARATGTSGCAGRPPVR
ncbi:sensor histidine kinase [Kocuria sp.]|uniref:sensor histidine kinase n=1 Tax=Kocuria sp. TaxID=1871328 RepID=UPI0026DF853E|nr:histidine kinase dimerization/phosphoacceptor domain-containing protein [Kocuria sp.]MDO5617207.1 histidine kinase dimerization/phosphoacceptor domain-containing protein [Kocuria sp.]